MLLNSKIFFIFIRENPLNPRKSAFYFLVKKFELELVVFCISYNLKRDTVFGIPSRPK